MIFLAVAFAAMTAATPPAPAPSTSVLVLIAAGEPGQPLTIHGQLVDDSGHPIPSARLHVYQTDASGSYTPEEPMDEPHARLSGWLQTDGRGHFEVRTIRPGGYPKALRLGDRDRKIPAHIHIDVNASARPARKVQVVFADDELLTDPYWQDWVKENHQPVLAVSQGGSVQTATLVLSLTHGNSE